MRIIREYPNLKVAEDFVKINSSAFEENEIIKCKDTQKEYKYKNKSFFPYEEQKPVISFNYYQMNKDIIRKLPFLTKKEVSDKIKFINNFFSFNDKLEHFIMLLNKEKSYYTIFVKRGNTESTLSKKTLGEIVIEVLRDLGKIYSIEFESTSKSIEIWLELKGIKKEIICLYLFNYDKGVIYYDER